MSPLTPQGQQKINEIAQRYGVSTDAVVTLLQSLVNGNGTMAQFNHRELGGSGQWMLGGMTMVGDMFNSNLKALIDNLCYELSNLLASQPFQPAPPLNMQRQGGQQQSQGGGQQQQQGGGYYGEPNQSGNVSLFVASGNMGNWWPAELGMPNSSGAQNNVRYAYFAGSHRLAVEVNGRVSVYDTLNHQIGGVSQQQGSGASVTFTSQYGTVDVLNLPIISGDAKFKATPSPTPSNPVPPPVSSNPAPVANSSVQSTQEADIFGKIERLAELKQKGIVSEEEFAAKKAELLSRL